MADEVILRIMGGRTKGENVVPTMRKLMQAVRLPGATQY